MVKYGKKRFAVCICLIFLFLSILPAVCFGAVGSGAGGGSCAAPGNSMVFSPGTTVESLRAELLRQGEDRVLVVLKPDGNTRTGGPIENGDRIEVTDDTGLVLSCVTAVIGSSSAASGPASVASSSGSSSGSSALPVSSVSPGPVPSFIQSGEYSVLTGPVTVSDLRNRLAESEDLQITSAAGGTRKSGRICTGDRIRILGADGGTICGTTAVVLGDLTRSGKATAHGCDLLYGYLTEKSALAGDQLAAADLDRDGSVNTADLLELKKRLANGS